MRRLEPAGGCSDGSSRVRLERRPDIVQVLEGDLLGTLEMFLAAVKWARCTRMAALLSASCRFRCDPGWCIGRVVQWNTTQRTDLSKRQRLMLRLDWTHKPAHHGRWNVSQRKIPASMYTVTTAWGGADTFGHRVCWVPVWSPPGAQ